MPESGRGARPEREMAGSVPQGATIRVMQGFYQGLELPLDRDWMVIGRGRAADVVLSDETVSRAHAAIGFDGNGFFVQDLGSTNGTRVNGESEPRAALRDGDEVRVGKLPLRVTLPH